MTTTIFEPNAVLIPEGANFIDNDREYVDPDECTKLFISGDLEYAEIYVLR